MNYNIIKDINCQRMARLTFFDQLTDKDLGDTGHRNDDIRRKGGLRDRRNKLKGNKSIASNWIMISL